MEDGEGKRGDKIILNIGLGSLIASAILVGSYMNTITAQGRQIDALQVRQDRMETAVSEIQSSVSATRADVQWLVKHEQNGD